VRLHSLEMERGCHRHGQGHRRRDALAKVIGSISWSHTMSDFILMIYQETQSRRPSGENVLEMNSHHRSARRGSCEARNQVAQHLDERSIRSPLTTSWSWVICGPRRCFCPALHDRGLHPVQTAAILRMCREK
jgi:hypothetical protein